MKRTQKVPWFLSGVLCAAILANTVAPAAAALVAKTIQVYTGIEVFVDDKKIDAGETHGNPDAFAYNGTTYVAVAAISKSLGEKVYWDGENKKVYIGEHGGASYNLLSVCPPYQTQGYKSEIRYTMAGKEYINGFNFRNGTSMALFNLNGQYDTLTFDVGHIDGEGMQPATIHFYLDDDLVYTLNLEPDNLPEHHVIPLGGAIQMKIVGLDYDFYYALTNLKVS